MARLFPQDAPEPLRQVAQVRQDPARPPRPPEASQGSPAIEQFNNTSDKNLATKLFKLLLKYRPEDDAQKKECLVATAQAEAAGKEVESKKPVVVKFGINHITYLVEQGKAQLVCIARRRPHRAWPSAPARCAAR